MSPLGKFILEHCVEYKGKRSFGAPNTGALFFRMRDVTPQFCDFYAILDCCKKLGITFI